MNFFRVPIIVASLVLPVFSAEKPNIILVMTDDQGYGDVAAHGHPFLKTPNLDALHKKSVRLTDFHVSSTCAPTRAALSGDAGCGAGDGIF